MTEPEKALLSVRCERHGLRFNPQTHDGCAVCRREGSASVASGPIGAAGGGLVRAVAVALVLIGLTAAGLVLLHSSVSARLRGNLPGLASGISDKRP